MHVNELPERWNTPDRVVCQLADEQDAVVVSKDTDFRNSFLLQRTPKKLLHICLGNTSNQRLIEQLTDCLLLLQHIGQRESFYLELNATGLQVVSVA
jgi:predicted nuclease of predicted toxin-antitoxin system